MYERKEGCVRDGIEREGREIEREREREGKERGKREREHLQGKAPLLAGREREFARHGPIFAADCLH